jgi:hypothetical protein
MSTKSYQVDWNLGGNAHQHLQQILALLNQVNAASTNAGNGLQQVGPKGSASAQQAKGAFDDLFKTLAQFVTIQKLISELIELVGRLGDAAKEAREKAEGKGEKSLDYREKAQELAALMGKPFADDQVLANVFRVGPRAGWNFDQSNDYLKEIYSGLPTAEKLGKIREDQYQEVAEAAAPGFHRLGIDPQTAGRMLGVAVQGFDVNSQVDAQGNKLSPADATRGLIAGIGHGLSVGGVGPISQLAQAEMKAAATSVATGRVADPMEASAWIGILSGIKGPGQAGTGYSQFENLLFRVGGDEGDFLDRTGISKLKTTRERATAMLGVLQAEGGDDWNSYLAEQGFGQKREREMVVATLKRLDAFDKLNAEVHAKGQGPGAAATLDRQFMASRPGRAGASEAAREANAWFGTGRHMESYLLGLREAEADLEADNQLESREKLQLDVLSDPLELRKWLGQKTPLRERLEAQMWKRAQERAKAKGIDLEKEGLASRRRQGGPDLGGFGLDPNAPLSPARPIEEVMERLDEMGAVEAVRPLEAIDALGAQGAAGGAGGGAAGGGPQAKVDAPDVKEGGAKILQAADKIEKAMANLGGRGGHHMPGPTFGAPIYPHRPGGSLG